VHLDGLVDLIIDPFTALNIVRGEPAADTLCLKVSIEALGEFLVFT